VHVIKICFYILLDFVLFVVKEIEF